ncbi:MAG: hypothetical protein ACNA7G_03985 [Methylobacter sp.]
MSILAKGKSVYFDDCYLRVELEGECVILTPMLWYKELQYASLKQFPTINLFARAVVLNGRNWIII